MLEVQILERPRNVLGATMGTALAPQPRLLRLSQDAKRASMLTVFVE